MNKLATFFSKFLEVVRRRDIYLVFFALLLSYFIFYPVQYFYPDTGEPSHNWIYRLVNGLTSGTIIIAYSYLILRIIFPDVYRFFENKFSEIWKGLAPEYQLNYAVWFYFLFIAVFLASVALLM